VDLSAEFIKSKKLEAANVFFTPPPHKNYPMSIGVSSGDPHGIFDETTWNRLCQRVGNDCNAIAWVQARRAEVLDLHEPFQSNYVRLMARFLLDDA